MCGIFALISSCPSIPVSLSEIRKACSLLQHRGPDQSGYAVLHDGRVGFGHNRLAIQDPDAPPQPLVDQHTGTTIIFNGEVYDHIEIGRELVENHNVTLTDATDTAVVLALYLLHGPTPEFFSRLNGEFSFVIWDAKRHQLIAARDRFGIKPLYWYYDGMRLAFSSEIKGIASLSGIKMQFSTDWLDNIDPGFSVAQHLTFMEGTYSVLPGEYLMVDLSKSSWDKPKSTTYWSPLPFIKSPSLPRSYQDAKDELRRLMTAAVKRRLVSNREICVYLSGGVDSTVVCGIIRKLGHPLTCLTIGFGDHAVSEEGLAAQTAQYYSLPHECVTYTLADTARELEKTIYHTEFPLSNPHAIAKLRLSEFAREKGFVVALTGEGSDEMFLGYAPFRSDILLDLRVKGGESAVKAERLERETFSKEKSSFLVGRMPETIPTVRGVPSWQAWHFNRLHVYTDSLRAPAPDGHPLPIRKLDNYASAVPEGLPGVRMAQIDWLVKLHNYTIPCLAERVEMASSIEGRPPFLDAEFSEFALQLPLDFLLDSNTLREKKILYDAFDDLLPPHIRSRTKQQFLAPPWYEALSGTKEGRELRKKYLSREAIEAVGVWSHTKVEELFERVQDEKELDGVIGLVLSIQVLDHLFIKGKHEGDPDFPMIDRSPQGFVNSLQCG